MVYKKITFHHSTVKNIAFFEVINNYLETVNKKACKKSVLELK